MTKDEALKLALEALEGAEALLLSMGLTHLNVYGDAEKSITAIREALAQPEQSYPDNFIHALMYDVARRDSEAQQAYDDAFVNGTGVMLGDKRIDPTSIYKEPEQEPVAWYDPEVMNEDRGISWTPGQFHTAPLYTTPPHRKPLTDEEIEFIYADTGYNDIQMFARAIEAAHGIKE